METFGRKFLQISKSINFIDLWHVLLFWWNRIFFFFNLAKFDILKFHYCIWRSSVLPFIKIIPHNNLKYIHQHLARRLFHTLLSVYHVQSTRETVDLTAQAKYHNGDYFQPLTKKSTLLKISKITVRFGRSIDLSFKG